MKEFIRNKTYDIIRDFSRHIFQNRDVVVEGLENIINDKEGGIIVSNHDNPQEDWAYELDDDGEPVLHTNSIDHFFVVAYLNPKQRIHAVVNKKAYKNILKNSLLEILQQIPATNHGIVDYSEKYLKKNEYVLIFPEGGSGQISKIVSGEKPRIYRGLGRLVSNLDNPKIFPMNIQINGKKDNLWPEFTSAKIKFGEQFYYLDEFDKFPITKEGNIDYSQISKNIMNEKVYPLA